MPFNTADWLRTIKFYWGCSQCTLLLLQHTIPNFTWWDFSNRCLSSMNQKHYCCTNVTGVKLRIYTFLCNFSHACARVVESALYLKKNISHYVGWGGYYGLLFNRRWMLWTWLGIALLQLCGKDLLLWRRKSTCIASPQPPAMALEQTL